jgi:hypothetical protein
MHIKFQRVNWNLIETIMYKGEAGNAFWKIIQFDGLRIRHVEYSKGYLADHWCKKGHIVHCLDGDFVTELESGDKFSLTKGMTYVVSDDLSSHRSFSRSGVKLLIIDGEFLSAKSYDLTASN